MKKNIGKAGKTIRLILGVVIIVPDIYFKSWGGTVGIVPIFTFLITEVFTHYYY